MIPWLLACQPELGPDDGLSGARLLRRISLDLRGVLPSPDQLAMAEADADLVPDLAASWLDDERFAERYVHLLQERWDTRIDEYLVLFEEYQELEGDFTREYGFERAVGEEPLRLAAWVVAEDRPWDDVALLEGTVANELLVELWPLRWMDDAPGSGWARARYTDGRPAAGVLTANGLWWRYYSTVTNKNRGRVAALSRLLLCEDYLNRPVSFEDAPALVDEEATAEALKSDPYCLGCHASIEPIAAALFGFWPADEHNAVEVHTYHPEREPLGEEVLGVGRAPGMNATGGKDHWTYTSAMLVGAGVAGGQVIGGYDENLIGTGHGGSSLTAAHFGATVLALGGLFGEVDPISAALA